MPLQFKLYYACAMYLLLWGSGFLLWMFYQSAVSGLGGEPAIITIIFLIVALSATTGYTGIRAIKNYKEAALLTKRQKAMFTGTYGFIVLFAIGMSLLLGLLIIPEELRRRSYDEYTRRINVEDLILTSGILFADIAAIYISATGMLLLKAVRLKHRDNLMSFEIEQP